MLIIIIVAGIIGALYSHAVKRGYRLALTRTPSDGTRLWRSLGNDACSASRTYQGRAGKPNTRRARTIARVAADAFDTSDESVFVATPIPTDRTVRFGAAGTRIGR